MKRLLLILLLAVYLPFPLAAQSPDSGNLRLRAALKNPAYQSVNFHLFIEGDERGIVKYFSKSKGKIKYRHGSRFAVILPKNEVEDLCSAPFVTRVYFDNYQASVLNDTMRVRNNVDSSNAGLFPLKSGFSGKNVLVAIIDTGVDFLHPDLRDSANRTRVLAVWDQTAPYDIVRSPSYGYGQVWDSTDINQGICTQVDNYAHGTTVAGCAAGNGRATGNHKGIAHDANIITVKSDLNSPTWLATMADAVDWICHIADSLNMPVVINASLGIYDGSHDGRDPAAQVIDSLIRAKRGRLMVCAAGNSGNSALYGNYHLHTDVDADTSFTWFTYNASSALGYGAVYFEVWADTAAFNQVHFAIGADQVNPIYSFRGRTDFRSVSEVLYSTQTDTLYNNGNRIAIVDYYAELMDDVYYLQVHMQQPDSNQYNFRFMSTGNGAFDVWSASWMGISSMVEVPLPTASQLPDIVHYSSPDSAKVIVSSFTCLPTVVTVANYAGANSYYDYNGTLQTFSFPVHQISVNSSRGPTRDNRLKPEVAATGDVTMSAGPLASLAWMRINEPFKVSQDTMHMRNGGTSMAAPVVTGIGALLLEKCPDLRWDEFSDIMTGTAKQDAFTQTVPNITWGHGKVDAFRALVATNFNPVVTGNFQFCFGESTTLMPDSYSNYYWSNGSIAGPQTISDSDTLQLVVSNQQGCMSDTAEYIITENNLPANPNIEVLAQTFPSDYIIATDTFASTYEWVVMTSTDTLIAGTDDSLMYSNPDGFYVFVSITDANGCSTNSDTLFLNIWSIEDHAYSGVLISPNPASNSITINGMDSPAAWKIFDLHGREVLVGKLISPGEILSFDLANGMYLLELNRSGGLQRIKFMVVK